MTTPIAAPFVRTRYTILAYIMLAYFAYLMAALGPAMPFLTDQLGLTYTQAGAHFTAFAAGMVIAGLSGDWLAQRFGRRIVFWSGALGMAFGAVMLITGQSGLVTTGASLVMGLLGGLLLVTIQASLADAHGVRRAVALSESNVASSFSAMLAPLMVGELQRNGLGWRTAVIVMLAFFSVVAVLMRHEEVVDTHRTAAQSRHSRRLPALFWLLWLVIFFGVAAEWSMGYWGAEFLYQTSGLTRADSSTYMTIFFSAIVIGRLIGSRLTHVVTPEKVLIASGLTALAGFPLFWASGVPLVTVVGLFLVGFGLGNIFPLTLSLAAGLVPGNANVVSARVSLGSGSAILIMPQVLGIVADYSSIQTAYGLVLVMLVLVVAAIGMAVRQLALQDRSTSKT